MSDAAPTLLSCRVERPEIDGFDPEHGHYTFPASYLAVWIGGDAPDADFVQVVGPNQEEIARRIALEFATPQPAADAAIGDAGLSAGLRCLGDSVLCQSWGDLRQLAHGAADDLDRLRYENEQVSAAIGSVRFLDPPDGGDVSLAEQVRRMRETLEAAEAREAQARRDVAERDAEITRLRREVEDTRATAERLHDSETRLREALRPLLNRYVQLASSGDCGFWDPEEDSEVIAARAALTENQAEADPTVRSKTETPGRPSDTGIPVTEQDQSLNPGRLDKQTTAHNSGRDARHESPAPDGWKLVPREPTEVMLDRGVIASEQQRVSVIYRAMWDAAPQAGQDGGRDG